MRSLSQFVSGLLLLLSWSAPAIAVSSADLQSVLDRHLRDDVSYWLEEPRLAELLRDVNRQSEVLDTAALATLDQRWRAEHASAGGEITDRVASRFVSNYLAEVALRLDGAYGMLIVLDNRGLVAAASDLPDHVDFSAEPCLQMLAKYPEAKWVQDRPPATGRWTRVAVPLRATDGARIGTLLFDIDVARLPAGSLAGSDTRRRDDSALSSRIDYGDVRVR